MDAAALPDEMEHDPPLGGTGSSMGADLSAYTGASLGPGPSVTGASPDATMHEHSGEHGEVPNPFEGQSFSSIRAARGRVGRTGAW